MNIKLPGLIKAATVNDSRRRLLSRLLLGSGMLAFGTNLQAQEPKEEDAEDMRFPGDEPEHKISFQLNRSDDEYHHHVLGSAGSMLRTYQDNVGIVVTCFGQGIHVLAKKPKRPVSAEIRSKVSSLDMYGVKFHACGRTLDSLGWTEDDLFDFVEVVPVGAADLMTLQENGYAYMAW
jgi:intracellular sulfur oxidation DsrE/DsrF family protein